MCVLYSSVAFNPQFIFLQLQVTSTGLSNQTEKSAKCFNP
jgi:hypothetical protein